MSKLVYLCVNDNNEVGMGDSLKDAYVELHDNFGGEVEDCTFYEATEVEVEIKLVKKEVVQKITAAASSFTPVNKKK